MAQAETVLEARRRVTTHADAQQDGFLGRLRQAQVDRAALDDLMDALRTLSRTLRHAESLDRVLVGQLWGIAFRARSWALSSDGRLVRDGQLSEVERVKLERWIAAYEWAVVGWLDGQDDDTALVLWREL